MGTKIKRLPVRPRIVEAAEAGDIDAVLGELRENFVENAPNDFHDYFKHLADAIEVCRKRSPDELARTALSLIMAMDLFLLVRCQLYIASEIRKDDRRNPSNDGGGIPGHLVHEWLPRLDALQQEVKNTAKALSTISHVQSLAKKAKDADPQEPADEQPGRRAA